MSFEVGSTVAMREVWKGTVWAARPMIVVRDDDELAAFWFPRGAMWKRPCVPGGDRLRLPAVPWSLVDVPWDMNDNLIMVAPGARHAVHVFYDTMGNGLGWYVNLQEPLCRTEVGFDYMDQALDIVAPADLSSWSWKDEDELAEGVELGVFTEEDARAIRREGEQVIERMQRRDPPFCDGWDRWRPDPAWSPPALPPGWNAGVRVPDPS